MLLERPLETGENRRWRRTTAARAPSKRKRRRAVEGWPQRPSRRTKRRKTAGAGASAVAPERAQNQGPVQPEAAIPPGADGRDWSKTLFLPETAFAMPAV